MLDVFVRLPGAPRWHTLAAGSPTLFKNFPALADRQVDFDRIWVVYLVDENHGETFPTGKFAVTSTIEPGPAGLLASI